MIDLPCPYCGDEARGIADGNVFCDCGASAPIEVWNTRAERTCHPVEEYLDMHSDLTATVCSSCRVAIYDLEDCNYCPNCGAKVVEND